MHHVVSGLCGHVTSLAGATAVLSDRVSALEAMIAGLASRAEADASRFLPAVETALSEVSGAVESLLPRADEPIFKSTPPPGEDDDETVASSPPAASSVPVQKNELSGVATAASPAPNPADLLEEMSDRFASMTRKQAALFRQQMQASQAAAVPQASPPQPPVTEVASQPDALASVTAPQ